MPRYDYYCLECDTHEEIERRLDQIGGAPLECPLGHVMRRVYSPVGVIFRGSGWAGKQ